MANSKSTKNSSVLTVIIAALAILYFAYNLRGTKPKVANLEELQPVVEKHVGALGELSAPVVDNPIIPNQNIAAQDLPPVPEINAEALSRANINASDIIGEEIPIDVNQMGVDINNIPEDLPEDLKEQLKNPPPLPDDLKAQLEAPAAPIPPDIEEALRTPPREVTIDEVNSPRNTIHTEQLNEGTSPQ